jgi:threonine synthase
MARLFRAQGYLADPHSAIGIAAARAAGGEEPVIAMATAHPAKFPDAVERATGVRPPLPPGLADLYDREECYTRLPNRLEAVQARVRATALRNAA